MNSECICVLQISEKQKSLYEALEKQQRYQGSLQSISTKMESLEVVLNEPPMHDLSPDRQMILHQVFHILKNFSLVLCSSYWSFFFRCCVCKLNHRFNLCLYCERNKLILYCHTCPESDGGHCQTAGWYRWSSVQLHRRSHLWCCGLRLVRSVGHAVHPYRTGREDGHHPHESFWKTTTSRGIKL